MTWKLYLSKQAEQEIEDIWQFGYTQFGLKTANDYDQLISQALLDLKEEPYRLGSKQARGFQNELFVYHLLHSNRRAGNKIKNLVTCHA